MVRCSNGLSVTNTMPADGLLMKPLIERPGKATALSTPGSFHRDVRHFADDLFGAVKRRALRQLREAHEILLVLQRHEARRHDAEDDEGRRQQERIDQQSRLVLCDRMLPTPRP